MQIVFSGCFASDKSKNNFIVRFCIFACVQIQKALWARRVCPFVRLHVLSFQLMQRSGRNLER